VTTRLPAERVVVVAAGTLGPALGGGGADNVLGVADALAAAVPPRVEELSAAKAVARAERRGSG